MISFFALTIAGADDVREPYILHRRAASRFIPIAAVPLCLSAPFWCVGWASSITRSRAITGSPDLCDLTFVSHSPMILPMEKARENATLIIAASLIAVVRLRGEPIKPSPKLIATIADSVQLARMVLEAVERRG
jgi:hypothetical protein